MIKIEYDKLTLDYYFISSKYPFLRKRKYTNYNHQMHNNIYYFCELIVYEIKIFGKWFIYRIKRTGPDINNPNHQTLDYIDKAMENAKKLNHINIHNKSKYS